MAFIDAAHRRGIAVILDVVYNHFGPEGNYLPLYAPDFISDRHRTPRGGAINFDGVNSKPVREFFIENALYWLEEFHLDGLRLDAIHAIRDDSAPGILTELAERVRARVARPVHLLVENDNNEVEYLIRGDNEPRLYTAQWNDDIHHALHVAATAEQSGYYSAYGDTDLLAKALSGALRIKEKRRLIGAGREVRRARRCRTRRSSLFCRTTTRSATARSANASTP
jgi:malto-oligosyltrehalose trehalohydrolase